MTVIVTATAGAREARDLLDRLPGAGAKLVCFYGAPWDAALAREAGEPDWIEAWVEHHAAVLQAWQAAPDRVVMVNAGRAGGASAVVARLAELGVSLDADRVPPTGDGDPAPWARALAAAHFADLAPAAWECYEALESCAQVTGDEPELRGTLAVGDTTDLEWILDQLREAVGERAGLQADHDQLATDLDRAVARMEAWEEGAAMLRRENELLLGQIEQFNAELDRVEGARAEAEAEVIALREEADATASLPVNDELPALRRENELLVLQLEQLHEELEQGTAHARAATRVAERAAMLGERARLLLSRQALYDASR